MSSGELLTSYDILAFAALQAITQICYAPSASVTQARYLMRYQEQQQHLIHPLLQGLLHPG
jgi:hypothetical protein